jgi:plastocyanin
VKRRFAALAISGVMLAAPQGAVAATYAITISDMAFGPAPANLKVGDTIEWVNADIFEHSATAKDRSFDVTLPAKGRGRTVLKHPGAIAFYCRYHPGMTGTLTISR